MTELKKISELTAADALSGSELLPGVQDGTTKKITIDQLVAAVVPSVPAGAQGDEGPAGPEGPQGPAGAEGATGPAGAEGPAGPEGPQGPAGAEGPQGPAGADGVGIPAGGTARQALVKDSGTDYDTIWSDIESADVAYDNALSGLTAADVQDAIDELADTLQSAVVLDVNGQTGNVVLGGEAIAEPVNVLTPAAGVVTIDCALGDYFTLAPTANVTSIVFTNLPAAGKAQTIMVRFTQDTTPRTVAWPASFRWAGGVAGAVSTGSGAIDVLAITTFTQGTTWMATLAKAFA